MILSRMILSTVGLFAALSISDTQHDNIQCRYAGCCYAECRIFLLFWTSLCCVFHFYAVFQHAECHSAERHSAECRGAVMCVSHDRYSCNILQLLQIMMHLKGQFALWFVQPRNANWKGSLSTIDPLIKLACFLRIVSNIFYLKRSLSRLLSTRRPTVLSTPFQ